MVVPTGHNGHHAMAFGDTFRDLAHLSLCLPMNSVQILYHNQEKKNEEFQYKVLGVIEKMVKLMKICSYLGL